MASVPICMTGWQANVDGVPSGRRIHDPGRKAFAPVIPMAIGQQLSQYARGRVVRRLSRSLPWVGAIVALAAAGTAIRRKGLFGGAVDSALDATPFVGALKNAVEAVRGRDFIKDKRIGG